MLLLVSVVTVYVLVVVEEVVDVVVFVAEGDLVLNVAVSENGRIPI